MYNKIKSDQKIKDLEEKNKNLVKEQKLAEIELEKISKGRGKEGKLKMIIMDCNKKQLEYQKLLEKAEKEKREKNENDAKIKDLKEWKEKLEKIASEMYNIQEMEDIKEMKERKSKNLELLLKYKKQYEVLENSKKSNKKKFDNIIAMNEKEIYQLNLEKTKQMKELQLQLKISDRFGKKINQFYGINESEAGNNANTNTNNTNSQQNQNKKRN